MKLNCVVCGKEISVKPSDLKLGRGKYCSNECKGENHLRDKNPRWKGGEVTMQGYVFILSPNHYRADRRGYVKRAVLVAEKKYGRMLQKGELVHHKNKIKNDDSPDNLEIIRKGYHNVIHFSKIPRAVKCRNCNTEFIDKRSQHRIFCGVSCAANYNNRH